VSADTVRAPVTPYNNDDVRDAQRRYTSRGLADGPETKERTDPREILEGIVGLDMMRTGEITIDML